jgi:hypothetical protein
MNQFLESALGEFRENTRLRVGAGLIASILWLYGLLVWDDSLSTQRTQLQQVEQDIRRLRPFQRGEELWRQRLAEARNVTAGFRSHFWEARSRSLAEAAFRDWLQSRAHTAGLKVTELAVRAQDGSTTAPAVANEPAGTSGSADDRPLAVRGRMVATFGPRQVASLLLQLHDNPRHVAVQRLLIRNPLKT